MKYVILKILLTTTAIFLSSFVFCQSESSFFKLRGPVKIWVITHPFSAGKAKKIAEKARLKSNEIKKDSRLDGIENGGQSDAFRHAYWMALTAREFNCRKAFRLGKAYEEGNKIDFRKKRNEDGELPDSVSVAMDLHNNCVGVFIGFENPDISEYELAEIVITRVLQGEMLIISKEQSGLFLDCEGVPIKNAEWRGIWNNRRCLVRSDHKATGN